MGLDAFAPRRVIMFDLDGTLIDTMGGFADVAASVMADVHGLERTAARRRYLETSGIPFRHQLELIVPDHPANDAAAERFEREKRACAEAADLDAETRIALEHLRAHGYRLVVSTNSTQAFADSFAARQAFDFDLVLGFDAATQFGKGAPHVDRVCSALRVSRANILFCGDSIKDGELAHACGLAFIARLGTFSAEAFRHWHHEVFMIADVAALSDLLLERVAA